MPYELTAGPEWREGRGGCWRRTGSLQREATTLALLMMQRVMDSRAGAPAAMRHVAEWCDDNTRGAEGLDIPGTKAPAPGAFMHAMAEAKGGWVTGPMWGRLMIPERHQDVMAREREARGQGKRKRLTGDVDDAPSQMFDVRHVRRLVTARKTRGTGRTALRVLVLFAGVGGATEGWKGVHGAQVVAGRRAEGGRCSYLLSKA